MCGALPFLCFSLMFFFTFGLSLDLFYLLFFFLVALKGVPAPSSSPQVSKKLSRQVG